jgi:hypothetical protein
MTSLDDAKDQDSLALSAASEAVKNAIIVLLKRNSSCCNSSENLGKSNEVKFMLYFDEARDMYGILCSCFNSFLPFPFS